MPLGTIIEIVDSPASSAAHGSGQGTILGYELLLLSTNIPFNNGHTGGLVQACVEEKFHTMSFSLPSFNVVYQAKCHHQNEICMSRSSHSHSLNQGQSSVIFRLKGRKSLKFPQGNWLSS